MEIYSTFADRFGNKFGTFYEAFMDRIDGVNKPVAYDGNDLKSLHPADNTDAFVYVRQSAPADVSMVDLGGESKTAFVNNKYRVVFYSAKPFNNFAMLQEFTKATQGLSVELSTFSSDVEQVYSAEIGGKKNLRVKNIGYMFIDFSIREQVNLCTNHPC